MMAYRALLVVALFLISAVQALADSYPSKPIRLLVGFAAGGPTDIAARQISAALHEELGQPVVVENKPGASGIVAAEALVAAPADGYTLLYASSSAQTTTPYFVDKMSFNPLTDYTPIFATTIGTTILVVRGDNPARSVKDLVAYAKANPGKVAYSSNGIGAAGHLNGELLSITTGTELVHVPYKGNAPALAAVLSGDTTFSFSGVTESRELIAAGKLRVLAVGSSRPHSAFPDVPTITQAAGLPSWDSNGIWFALEGPPNLPKPIVDRLVAAMNKVMERQKILKFFSEAGYQVLNEGPEELARRVQRENAMWKEMAPRIRGNN
jgi:tripartite-type tricarboxylate transporter receptor subunit TctC